MDKQVTHASSAGASAGSDLYKQPAMRAGTHVLSSSDPYSHEEEEVPRASTGRPQLSQQSCGEMSSVDPRLMRGRGSRPADRSRGAAVIQWSSAPLPTQRGYFRFGSCQGLAFMSYSWHH